MKNHLQAFVEWRQAEHKAKDAERRAWDAELASSWLTALPTPIREKQQEAVTLRQDATIKLYRAMEEMKAAAQELARMSKKH